MFSPQLCVAEREIRINIFRKRSCVDAAPFFMRYKARLSAHTVVERPEEGVGMSKKKKKIRTLTDEQYNEYLMALKDERPTMLIDKNGNRVPQK